MNRAIKSLLKDEPQALKALNEVFHFDYNKPYQAFKIDGNTTIKQILKKVENPQDKLIVVLNYQNHRAFWNDRYEVGIIDHMERVEVDYKPHYFHAKGLETYNSKGDFRQDLKSPQTCPHHIIIAQDKALLTAKKPIQIDYTDRYKIDTTVTYGGRITSLSTGRTIEQYKHRLETENIDKSGYIVEYYRDNLKRRAKALKAERDKTAYIATDNTARIEELKIRIAAKKLEIIERLKAADTSEQLKEVAKSLEYWSNGYTSIVSSFEDLQKRVANKSYPSIEDFNRNYEGINQMLLNNGR